MPKKAARKKAVKKKVKAPVEMPVVPEVVATRTEPQPVPKELPEQVQEPEQIAPVEAPIVKEVVPEKTVAIGEAIGFAWKAVKSRLGFFIGVFLFQVVLALIETSAKGIATKVLVSVFHAGVTVGSLKIALDLADDKEVAFKELFSSFPRLISFVVTTIIYVLTIALGLVLVVVPGIIWGLAFSFYAYAVIADKAGPMTALKKSAALTESVKPKLLVFYLALLGINLLGLIPLGLGLIMTLPVSFIAIAHVYRQLEKQSSHSL